MITVYTVTYNEEVMIQFMIDHYRERFPGCHIVIYDNMSTDNTIKIAKVNGCEVVPFDTRGAFMDRRNMDIKNSCWKSAETDWVLMCDLDELLDINQSQLKKEEALGITIIKSKGYDMVAMDENLDIAGMKYGVRDDGHDKSYLFNKKFIQEINYNPGAHLSDPKGVVKYSKKRYICFHYCFINYKVTVAKYKVYSSRKMKSPEDIMMHWGGNFETPEEIRKIYTDARRRAVKIR